MNDIVRYEERNALTAADMRTHVNRVQEVMQAVMKGPSRDSPNGVHYGKIPGTPKPTLYKPGAEVLCMAFHIAPKFNVEDLSTADYYRYRVTCVGVHQASGVIIAEGMGSASSNEEKYKWRAAICDEEFDLVSDNRRRLKFKKYEGKVSKLKQVRAEPDDIDNTILKMACKRAQVAMTLNATAASDIFSQDIEDLPEHLRAVDNGEGEAEKGKALPIYLDADFEKHLPDWKKLIESGKHTANALIAKLSTRATFTDKQKDALRVVKKTEAAPAVTYAMLMDRMNKTKDIDMLDADATLIDEFSDEAEHEELTARYKSRRAELEAS